MNKRNFLKTLVMGISSSLICSSIDEPTPEFLHVYYGKPLPSFLYVHREVICLLTIDELNRHGITSSPYYATCVDNTGKFFGQDGYNNKKSCPFLVKCYELKCIPKCIIPSEVKLDDSMPWHIPYKNYETELIAELKEKYAYVTFVGYGIIDDYNNNILIPMIRGLSKIDYYNRISRCDS